MIGSGNMDVPMSGGIREESGEEKMVMEPWWRSAKWMEDMEVETRVM